MNDVVGRALQHALDELHVLLLVGRHLVRQGAQPRVAGGDQHVLEERLRALAREMAAEEQSHVLLIERLLENTPEPQPGSVIFAK